jgi:hypothetical protein
MSKIAGSFEDALKKLSQYSHLCSIIDPVEFEAKARKKYPNGPEILPTETSDLLTALLIKDYPELSQATNNAATPEGVISNINEVLGENKFTPEQLAQIAVKLLNFRTTSFWDTLTELLLYRTISKNVPPEKLAIEFPLGVGKKGSSPKDADIAILGDDLKPRFLIDAVAPNMPPHVNSASDMIVDSIEKKYRTKFQDFCTANPNAQVSIVVSIIKAEMIYIGFPMKLVDPNHVEQLYSAKLDALPGLVAGYACSFRCPDGKTLILDHVARYERGKTP